MSEHIFGSGLTDIKLAMVEAYLRAFTTALQGKPNLSCPFELWYIDAFAGTGERTIKLSTDEPSLWVTKPSQIVEAKKGSARIALETSPQFDRLFFFDRKKSHAQALKGLKREYPDRQIEIRCGDANKFLQESIDWKGWNKVRGVLFLDPYGMSVDWETLKGLSEIGSLDIWYLVSLSGLYRQATVQRSKLDESKRCALNRMLGTDEWEKAWYPPDPQAGLFDAQEPRETVRQAKIDIIEKFVTKRLKTIFPLVKGPRRLYNDRGSPMFSLYFLVSNKSSKAQALAGKIADHILISGN